MLTYQLYINGQKILSPPGEGKGGVIFSESIMTLRHWRILRTTLNLRQNAPRPPRGYEKHSPLHTGEG